MVKFENIVQGDEFTLSELCVFANEVYDARVPGLATDLMEYSNDVCIEQAGILWHFRLHANEDKWMAMTKYVAELL